MKESLKHLSTKESKICDDLKHLNELKMIFYGQMSFNREVQTPYGDKYNPNELLEKQIEHLEKLEKEIRGF